MQCPKCGFEQAAGAECSQCGVIFAKIRREPDQAEQRLADRFLRPPIEELLEPNSLHIEQEAREMLEIFSEFEVANEYTIRDGAGKIRAFAVEQGRGAGAAVRRSFLGANRPLHIAVISFSEREVILEMNRPFVFYFSNLTVSAGAKRLGAVLRRFSLLNRTYELVDASNRPFAKIVSPILKIWTFNILDPSGRQRGEISKKWSGFTQEYITDADRFRVTFGDGWTTEQKAVLLAAAFSIDFDFFENNQRRR